MSLRALVRDRRGSTAATFAISLIPIVGLAGGMIDYSLAVTSRTQLQSAVDAAALTVSKEASGLTNDQIKSKATAYFNALYTSKNAGTLTVDASMTTAASGEKSVTVTAQTTIKTVFIGLLGIDDLTVKATSVATWGSTKLRVALALDNTGSMNSSGKMTALKTASKNLLTQLKSAATKDGDVYVSIIPFSKDVNVGSGNVNASWLRWDLWDSANGSWQRSGWSWQWVPASHSTWNGCVTDRDQDYDTKNTAPSTSTSATLYPTEQYSNCPVSLMALTYDWTALNSKVDAMSPNGNTNQGIGLQWAFSSLTSGPLTVPALDPDYKYQHAIVLFTDGLNTENRWYSTQSSIDARQKKTCDNAKAAGIIIYAVQVNTGNDATSTLLQQCASDSSKFFLLTSASQIITTFDTIGTSLTQLRLSK